VSEVRATTVGEDAVAAHLALAGTTYADEALADGVHFRWKHLQPPSGPSLVLVLDAEDHTRLLGHVFLQRRFWVESDGTEYRAGLITDLVLAPDARDARRFVALMSGARASDGIDVVIHTSNETSEPLYRRLLRYPVACELEAYGAPTGRVRIGDAGTARERFFGTGATAIGIVAGWAARAAAPLLRGLARVSVSSHAPPDATIDSALAAFAAAAGPHLRRDRPFIAWRFGECPNQSKVSWVRLSDQEYGYIATARVTVGTTNAIAIQDAVLPRMPRRLEGLALRMTVMAMSARAGAGVVIGLWNPRAPLARWMTGLPFVKVPSGFLPHASPIFLASSPPGSARAFSGEVFLALADLDYF